MAGSWQIGFSPRAQLFSDMLAGPTEVVIVSGDGNPEFIAADLVAQAEHDADAVPIFITSSATLARAVQRETRRASRGNRTAQESLRRNGLIVVAASNAEALAIANQVAPEHITVSREDVMRLAEQPVV